MGYTHYWYLNPKSEEVRGIEKSRFNAAVIEMGMIVTASPLLAGWDGEGGPMLSRDEISFNGIGDDGHESFTFQRFGTQGEGLTTTSPEDTGKDFSFCKTAARPLQDRCKTAARPLRSHTMSSSWPVWLSLLK